jgi:hypothetical protein
LTHRPKEQSFSVAFNPPPASADKNPMTTTAMRFPSPAGGGGEAEDLCWVRRRKMQDRGQSAGKSSQDNDDPSTTTR